jgi:CRP-like cAMP-binding protein
MPNTTPVGPAVQNKLLAAIPGNERERVLRELTPVFLSFGETLYESGAQLNQVYFPTSAIVSLSYVMADDTSAEIAVVGNEGVVGVALFMGEASTPGRAVVHGAGWAYSFTGALLKQEFTRGGAMLPLLLRYTQVLLAQMTQTLVCNRHHSVDQKLCRWLLLRLDRMDTDELTMMQEAVVDMVGVRREEVIAALGSLRSAGLLHYCQSHITVVDRAGLEARSCECYGVVKSQSQRLFYSVVAPEGSQLRPRTI